MTENTDFFQTAPLLKNQFSQDPLLSRYLQSRLPKDIYQSIETPLKDLGEKAAGEMLLWAEDAERNPPQHVPFDAWGNRVDELCEYAEISKNKVDQLAADLWLQRRSLKMKSLNVSESLVTP